MPVTAPADRRFLRAQVKPGRRHRPWRAWLRAGRVVAALVVAGWMGWLGIAALAGSAALSVRSIVVSGNLARSEMKSGCMWYRRSVNSGVVSRATASSSTSVGLSSARKSSRRAKSVPRSSLRSAEAAAVSRASSMNLTTSSRRWVSREMI